MGTMDRPSSLYLSVKREIKELIASGEFKLGDRLPSEFDLAKKYSVSRMTLREALRALEEEGLLARKQGLGTFVKATSTRIKSILDVNLGVTEMITNMGFHPGTMEIKVEEIGADSQVARALNIKEGSKVIAVERVRTANAMPVVYSLDRIPPSVIPDPQELKLLGESIYDFLESKCHVVLSGSLARLFAAKADRKLAAKLGIRMNSPLLYLEQVDTDQAGRPILYSSEYFINDYFDFVIYRRRNK